MSNAHPSKKRKVAFDAPGDSTTVVSATNSTLNSKRSKVSAKRTNGPASAAVQEPSPKAPLPAFKIVAGSYEKILYGLEGTFNDSGSGITLKPVFIFPAHLSCIRAVAASPMGGKWLVTGATDEIIKVWDLRRKKEVGGLMQHEGSITQLSFPTRSYLFSSSEDGTIVLFRVKDWVPLKTLKGHKGRVNSFAIHPSLKVALSVGKDKMLRMWDLNKGKSVASTKLGKEGEVIRWSPGGKHFVVLSSSSAELYSTDMKLLSIINHRSRLHDVRFYELPDGKECMLLAAEDQKVSVYDVQVDATSPATPWAEFTGHKNRVKGLDILKVGSLDGITKTLMVTASSDGFINVYDIARLHDKSKNTGELVSIEPLAQYDTQGTRLTCVTLAEASPALTSQIAGRKRSIEEQDKEEDDGENEIIENSPDGESSDDG